MANPVADVVALSGNQSIDGLVQGGRWDSTALTYSFSIETELGIGWSAALKSAVRYAFSQWSAVADLTFQEVAPNSDVDASPADIAMAPTGTLLGQIFNAAAIGIFPDPDSADSLLSDLVINRSDSPNAEGDVYLDNARPELRALNMGGSAIEVILHEIGHALGLKHPQDDGLNGRPVVDLDPFNTVMDGGAVRQPLATGHAVTPLLYDIQAIQYIYGANMSYHAGDDTYALRLDGTERAVWDAGGIDTFDFSAASAGITLSLEAGQYNILPSSTLVAIAFGVTIENAVGGRFGDALTGNSADNRLEGGGGDDTLDGGDGGNDTLVGGAGNDVYQLLHAGAMIVEGPGGGDDQILDFVAFVQMGENVERLFVEPDAPDGATVIGGSGPNAIAGSFLSQHLEGGAGNDTLDGGGGNDTLVGGPGDDLYRLADPGSSFIELPGEGVDTIEVLVTTVLPANFENLTLVGSAAIDAIGNSLANVLRGNFADNFLDGREGPDTLMGGDGNDSYVIGPGDVVIDAGGSRDSAVSTVGLATMPTGLDDVSLTGMAGRASRLPAIRLM